MSKTPITPMKWIRKHWLALLCAVLLVTNMGTFYMLRGELADDITSFQERFPFIDLSRHLIAQEHFITTLQPVREYLQGIVASEGPETISIYLEYLNTGANISINQDLRIFPASLVKVPLAMAVMKKVQGGDWKLHNELVLMPEDKDPNWGDVHKRPIGTRITIDELLHEMLVSSDNTAFRMLYRNLSFDELQDVMIALGLEDLFNEEGKITAKEYTRLFRALYTSSYLNRENSQMLLDVLSKTGYDEYLGQAIPEQVPFAHKIGENEDEEVMLDAGIVYIENRPYLIAVAVDYGAQGITREQGLELLKKISGSAYDYISTYASPN
ncbi:MAG: serine hydrolase [Candidatus Pacebacteria bacterium]|nr:serine hydrolase [Candidatus Paceibacterota bacterium]